MITKIKMCTRGIKLIIMKNINNERKKIIKEKGKKQKKAKY